MLPALPFCNWEQALLAGSWDWSWGQAIVLCRRLVREERVLPDEPGWRSRFLVHFFYIPKKTKQNSS